MDTEGKVMDNYLKSFPARMSDGRFITDYTPNCDKNLLLKKKMSGWEYRNYLINNAEEIMNKEVEQVNQMFGCLDCNNTVLLDSSVKQVCDQNGCNIEEVSKDGIGIEQEHNVAQVAP